MADTLEDALDRLLAPIEKALDDPSYIADAANKAYAASMRRQEIPVKTGATRRALTHERDPERRLKIVKRKTRGGRALTITWWISTPGAVYRRRTIPRLDDRPILDACREAIFERTRGYRRS